VLKRVHNIAKYPFTKHTDAVTKYYHITSVRMHMCERLHSHFLGDCNKISIFCVHDLHTSPPMTNLFHLVSNIMIFTSSEETAQNFCGATDWTILCTKKMDCLHGSKTSSKYVREHNIKPCSIQLL